MVVVVVVVVVLVEVELDGFRRPSLLWPLPLHCSYCCYDICTLSLPGCCLSVITTESALIPLLLLMLLPPPPDFVSYALMLLVEK